MWLAATGICIVQVDNMVGTRASARLRAATKEELNTPIPDDMPDEDHEDKVEEEQQVAEEEAEKVNIRLVQSSSRHDDPINRLAVSQLHVGNVMSSKLPMSKVSSWEINVSSEN